MRGREREGVRERDSEKGKVRCQKKRRTYVRKGKERKGSERDLLLYLSLSGYQFSLFCSVCSLRL